MTEWQELPDALPADGTEYWVVLLRWFGRPFKATWADADSGWKTALLGTYGIIPWYIAPHWREV